LRNRLLAALALFTLVLITLGTGVASAQTVTIGQTLPGSVACGGPSTVWFIQTSPPSYAVPAGNWNLTSWSTLAGTNGGSMGLMVFRPTGSAYTVVGASPVEPLTANSLNTFTLAVPIAVQGGDLLGLTATSATACGTFTSGTVVGNTGAPPSVGTTVTPPLTLSPRELNISATLSPARPTTKDECKDGGWQSFGVFKNQGDCVSYVATGGKNPPAH
jgi:hypothetical protein